MAFGGLSGLGTGLYSFGIPKDSVITYETSIKSDKFLVVVHGAGDEELAKAKNILKSSGHEVSVHSSSEK